MERSTHLEKFGKSTISIRAIFNSYVTNYQRVVTPTNHHSIYIYIHIYIYRENIYSIAVSTAPTRCMNSSAPNVSSTLSH